MYLGLAVVAIGVFEVLLLVTHYLVTLDLIHYSIEKLAVVLGVQVEVEVLLELAAEVWNFVFLDLRAHYFVAVILIHYSIEKLFVVFLVGEYFAGVVAPAVPPVDVEDDVEVEVKVEA